MAKQRDIRRLIKKGLTGTEAAKLILEDSWEVDHRRDGFLSESDIQAIKKSLKDPGDIQEYNRWIEAYRIVDYTLKEAHIQALEATEIILMASRNLDSYYLEDKIRGLQLFALPAIVTEKQYQELSAKQREILLREKNDLGFILADRAYHLASEEQREECELDSWTVFGEYPELREQAIEEILELIQAGRLKPVQLHQEDIDRLEGLEEQSQAKREEDPPDWKKLEALYEEREELKKQAYERAREQQEPEGQASIIASLEQYKAGSLPDREREKLLGLTYCSGEELYQTGLPEWIKWIDTYKPDLDEETAARPADTMQSTSVAILQDPEPNDLDERGYYKDEDILASLSGLASKDSEERVKQRGFTNAEFIQTAHKAIRNKLKDFLAIQAVVETISGAIGVDFTEDLKQWYERVQIHIDHYNLLVDPKSRDSLWPKAPHYLGMPKLPALRIGRLKPTAKTIQYYRERIALGLGDNWWNELISMDFEQDEEDSLAMEAVQEFKKLREEAQNGQS